MNVDLQQQNFTCPAEENFELESERSFKFTNILNFFVKICSGQSSAPNNIGYNGPPSFRIGQTKYN
jgi:hypothetical protein